MSARHNVNDDERSVRCAPSTTFYEFTILCDASGRRQMFKWTDCTHAKKRMLRSAYAVVKWIGLIDAWHR